MQFVLTVKELWRRRLWIAPGVVLAFLLAGYAVFQLPSLQSRQTTIWTANSQVLVDAHSSAVGDLNQGLGVLIPRASVYGSVMTSLALVDLIAHAAGLPASEISVAGPIGTNGKRPQHGATAPPGAPSYSLQLDTDITQPTIRITAQASTGKAAVDLANGAASGLTTYVTQLEDAQQVTTKHRVDIRQLGGASVNQSTSGIAPPLLVPIFLVLAVVWCMLVLFVTRFAAAWRDAPELLALPYGGAEHHSALAADPHRDPVEADGQSGEGLPEEFDLPHPDRDGLPIERVYTNTHEFPSGLHPNGDYDANADVGLGLRATGTQPDETPYLRHSFERVGRLRRHSR